MELKPGRFPLGDLGLPRAVDGSSRARASSKEVSGPGLKKGEAFQQLMPASQI
jgi:hypothetical protein